jgi:molybdate transport system permease protein
MSGEAADKDVIQAVPRARSDLPFYAGFVILGGTYLVLVVAMLLADASFTSPGHLWSALQSREIRYAIRLSLITCSLTAILSVWVATPIGYLLSRHSFRGKALLDAILDIPIVLPPLVIGLSLLILFQTPPGRAIQRFIPVTYEVPSIVLAQFSVACAFAVRTLRATFDQIPARQEHVALTLGCSRSQAFWRVVFPEARRGLLTALTLAWARSLGEFGPILIFSGATRLRTEVLSTSVFLELSVGNIEAAVAVSLLMVIAAVAVLMIIRLFGLDRTLNRPL